MKWLDGKKTYIGSVILSIIALVWGIDGLVHDNPATPDVTELAWFTFDQYTAAITFVGGLTGASLRLAVSKVAR